MKVDARTTDEAKILAAVQTAAKRFVRNKDKPEELETLRFNLIIARAYSGYSAVEAAKRFGYKNSTQLSLIESGNRKIPNDSKFLRQAAKIYNVSCDFLLGLSPHRDIDTTIAQQYAMMRGIQDILLQEAAMRTSAMILYTQQTQPTEEEFKRVEASMAAMIDGISVMREKYDFDEIRGSAPVVKAVEQGKAALEQLRGRFARFKSLDAIFKEFSTGTLQPMPHLMERYSQRDLLEGLV